MKVKVDQKLLDAEGKEITAHNKPSMTLRDVIINSILSPTQEDDEKKKFEKYEIFKKVRDAKNGIAELKAEEIATIKKSIGKLQPPLIMGQCFEMIEDKVS
jgi:hypothetical protein